MSQPAIFFAEVNEKQGAFHRRGVSGVPAAASRAREVMGVALVEDSDIRARIKWPLPMRALDPHTTDGGAPPTPPSQLAPSGDTTHAGDHA